MSHVYKVIDICTSEINFAIYLEAIQIGKWIYPAKL